MFACQDPSSMRFIPMYHDVDNCKKCKSVGTFGGGVVFEYRQTLSLVESARFIPFPRHLSIEGQIPTSDSADPSNSGYDQSSNGPHSASHVSSPAAMSAHQQPTTPAPPRVNHWSPESSRKEPEEDDSKIVCNDETIFAVEAASRSVETYLSNVSVPSPIVGSESRRGFASSSPYSSASKTPNSDFFLKAHSAVPNRSDSGIAGCSSYDEPNSESRIEISASYKSEKRITILKRDHPAASLVLPVKYGLDRAEKPHQNDVRSIMNQLTIDDDFEDAFCSADSFPYRASEQHRSCRMSSNSLRRQSMENHVINEDIEESSILAFQYRRTSVSYSDRKPRTAAPICAFCKNNNEPKDFATSHAFKVWDPRSRTLKLNCPVLRSLTCPKCGATGDNAHTITYCPKTIREVGHRPESLISKINSSAHYSSGKRRN